MALSWQTGWRHVPRAEAQGASGRASHVSTVMGSRAWHLQKSSSKFL